LHVAAAVRGEKTQFHIGEVETRSLGDQ